jgi:1-deoxy-D-xylulose-5-phosphate reductoisomerase
LASLSDADIIVNAVVGSAGLAASLQAVEQGMILALANKESLVAGGGLFAPICQKTGAVVHPIDSEHSALWQALQGNDPASIKSLILTASGGPFRTFSADQLQDVTVEEALSHPTWRMGPKVTIDSATLANKGLEIIEAVMLFGLPRKKVQVVVHPQSIVHSMIEFADSSVMAQLSTPDMRLPISYALSYPDRWDGQPGTIEWSKLSTLTFEMPDTRRFPCLQLAMDAADDLGTAPAIFNAANESAVAAFLERSISFVQIPEVIARVREQMTIEKVDSLDDILLADQQSRQFARTVIEKLP